MEKFSHFIRSVICQTTTSRMQLGVETLIWSEERARLSESEGEGRVGGGRLSWPSIPEWGSTEKHRVQEGSRGPSVLLAHALWSHTAREKEEAPLASSFKFKAGSLRTQGWPGFSLLVAVSEAAIV